MYPLSINSIRIVVDDNGLIDMEYMVFVNSAMSNKELTILSIQRGNIKCYYLDLQMVC